MFVSSWLEKPKQTQHQSSEALNCDLFCQSCENKGCIKCPATTVGWSDSSAQESECCRQRICLHGEVWMDGCFLKTFFCVFDLNATEAGTYHIFRGVLGVDTHPLLYCILRCFLQPCLHFWLRRCSSAVLQLLLPTLASAFFMMVLLLEVLDKNKQSESTSSFWL